MDYEPTEEDWDDYAYWSSQQDLEREENRQLSGEDDGCENNRN